MVTAREAVLHAIEDVTGVQGPGDDVRFDSLGDSLQRLEIAVEIETALGVLLPEDIEHKVATVGELVAAVERAMGAER